MTTVIFKHFVVLICMHIFAQKIKETRFEENLDIFETDEFGAHKNLTHFY